MIVRKVINFLCGLRSSENLIDGVGSRSARKKKTVTTLDSGSRDLLVLPPLLATPTI